MSERVKVSISDGVADVQLVRSEKMNALDQAMFEAIIAAGQQVSADPSVRCVVLSGDGRAFCAGLDMGNFAAMANGGSSGGDAPRERQPLAARTHGLANQPQAAVWVWHECPVPVIAAVHGVAFGGGFQLMLGADIRLVHPDTKLSIMEIKWGLIPDMAGTPLMAELARGDVIRELTYTGRVFSGREAVDFGFGTRTSDDPRSEALAVAAEIASKSPSAIQSAKRMFNTLPGLSAADALLQESVEQDAVIGSENQIEAVMASLEKRAGNFDDLR